MTRLLLELALACGFAAGAVGLSAARAADGKDKPAGAKTPDWSNYAAAGEVAGEVVAADENGITLRVSWVGPKTNRYGGLTRGRGRQIQVKENHEDFDLKYADGGLVRWKKMPPKIGADGKKGIYTEAELAAFHQPIGVPGYAADRSTLQPGHLVEIHLLRPKGTPAAKATTADLTIKYAMIVGQSATPPTPDKKPNTKAAPKQN